MSSLDPAWKVRLRGVALWPLTAALLACGGDEDAKKKACTPGTEDGCRDGQVCEDVVNGEPACFARVVVRGRVLDLATGEGVEGATVVALDVNGSARSSVVLTGDDGAYELWLPVQREMDGTPVDDAVTLRVAASGYQEFPAPPREALPIDPSGATSAEASADALVVMNAATDVGLIKLGDSVQGFASVSGSVAHELGAGALVVAVQDGRAVSTAVADVDGEFTLFNVPPGETHIEAYRAGLQVTPETLAIDAGDRVEDVVLEAGSAQLATVSGSVNIVDAEGGLTTSVILVLESTFEERPGIARGIAPAGLRAADVSGAFAIEGVPPGKYAVLAAFENDRLVRDPDEGIAGTDVVHIEIPAEGGDVALAESFKITEALEMVGPGADGLEALPAGGDLVFTWADDSSEDGYELRVFDAFGELVHEALGVPRVTGSARVTYTWSGAETEPGMIYQFRVMSYRDDRARGGGRSYISATEDLRGVFQVGDVEP